jgi:hypothetical protein
MYGTPPPSDFFALLISRHTISLVMLLQVVYRRRATNADVDAEDPADAHGVIGALEVPAMQAPLPAAAAFPAAEAPPLPPQALPQRADGRRRGRKGKRRS